MAFAADSRSIYYILEDPLHKVGGTLYRVALEGGTPVELLVGASRVRVSPDGRQLLYARNQGGRRAGALLLADADGSNERVVVERSATRTILGAAWSQSGEDLAFVVHGEDAGGDFWELLVRGVAGGPERALLAHRRQEIAAPAYLPDGKGLIVRMEDELSGKGQLWHVSESGGAPTRITRDLNHYGHPILTADGQELATAQTSRPARMWIAPLDDPTRARPLMNGTGGYGDLAWTPDGRVVYVDPANGESNLWAIDVDGGDPKQLTKGARTNYQPDVSADGRFIVFLSTRTGNRRLWRIDADGGNPVQLGDHEAWLPQCSPDSRSVVYETQESGRRSIWSVPLAGGDAVRLVEPEAGRPSISPDGQWLAYESVDSATKRHRLVVRPLEGGPPLGTFDLDAGYDTLRWASTGEGVLYTDGYAGETIQLQPLTGGPPRPVLTWPHETLFSFAVSRDGKWIAYTSGLLTSDVILFRNLM